MVKIAVNKQYSCDHQNTHYNDLLPHEHIYYESKQNNMYIYMYIGKGGGKIWYITRLTACLCELRARAHPRKRGVT